MPLRIDRVPWSDIRAVALRQSLDDEMAERYGSTQLDDSDFAAKAREAFSIDPSTMVATFLAIDAPEGSGQEDAVGHAALRALGNQLEVKRVIVAPAARGRRIATRLMQAVEDEARARGSDSVVLQTGDRQPDAIALYEQLDYRPIPLYPPYTELPMLLCYGKKL